MDFTPEQFQLVERVHKLESQVVALLDEVKTLKEQQATQARFIGAVAVSTGRWQMTKKEKEDGKVEGE